MKKIVFFGAADFILPIIKILHQEFHLTLVITTERDPSDSVPAFCKTNTIPYLSIKDFSECMERITKENAELGVLASFGLILPKQALNIFPKGIINIHPSLLPLYRGAMPVQTALLHGDAETGVSIIKLDEKMDHGPLLAQEKEKVFFSDTTASLHERLFARGSLMLDNILHDYLEDKIPFREQNHSQATFTKNTLSKQDGFVDYNDLPDKTLLDRMIRAYYPWPTVWTKITINGKEKIVKLLPDNKLQVEGKNPMSLKDFINGYTQGSEIVEKLFS